MARNFNKFIKRMEKGGSRSTGCFQRTESDRNNSHSSRQDSSKNSKKKDLQCHECEGFGHFRNKCPLAKRRELKCIECKGFRHTRSECPNNLKKDKSLACFSDTESKSDSDGEELLLNFVALIGQEDDQKPQLATDSCNEEDEDDDLNHDLEMEYKSLFNKFAELSHENLQLLKDKAMLKAQVNILELEQPCVQTLVHSIMNESDQEILPLKRAMTEQERVHKQFEAKFIQLSELLIQEKDKSKLLESQLSENLKTLRILNMGTSTLDHLLTLEHCPKSYLGLGYHGSTSKPTGLAEQTAFVKEASNVTEFNKPNGVHSEKSNDRVTRRRGIGCLFCGKQGHNVRFCHFRRH
ncbi:hypothetical protein N665_0681s0015 [Sinapis alba]|nr:hypothetical protein N665_0681s0015 [Sinapis alba]